MEITAVVSNWNSSFPNYQITVEHLKRPTPMFVVEAVFEILDSLEIDGDGIIYTQWLDMRTENSETISELLSLFNLAEAVNTLLGTISENCIKFCMDDLLTPAPRHTQTMLQVLLNFLIFVKGIEEQIVEGDKEVEELIQHIEEQKIELDMLTDKQHMQQEEGTDRDHRLKEMAENIEFRKRELNEYNEKLDEMEARVERQLHDTEEVATALAAEQASHALLQDEINKLRNLMVSDAEAEDVQKAQELAMQRKLELTQGNQDADSRLWMKDSTIKTLHTCMAGITECQNALDTVFQVFKRKSEMEGQSDSGCQHEAELRKLKEALADLNQQHQEVARSTCSLQQELSAAQQQSHQEQQVSLGSEKEIEQKYEENLQEICGLESRINEFKQNTFKYDKARSALMEYYTKVIPAQFDDETDAMIEQVKYFFRKHFGQKTVKKVM